MLRIYESLSVGLGILVSLEASFHFIAYWPVSRDGILLPILISDVALWTKVVLARDKAVASHNPKNYSFVYPPLRRYDRRPSRRLSISAIKSRKLTYFEKIRIRTALLRAASPPGHHYRRRSLHLLPNLQSALRAQSQLLLVLFALLPVLLALPLSASLFLFVLLALPRVLLVVLPLLLSVLLPLLLVPFPPLLVLFLLLLGVPLVAILVALLMMMLRRSLNARGTYRRQQASRCLDANGAVEMRN